jgi:pimeloyl-ACP methyl ester carboxylesterase
MKEFVEVGGLRIAYERAGRGPALVLLHGFVADGGTTWSRQLDELSDEFTVVAWDAPGAGRSAAPPPSFRLGEYADCLAGFVRALKLDRPYVVGLSFGGSLALELCRRHPAVPRALVLAAAYAGWAGSLDPVEVADRVRLGRRVADLPPDEFADALLPSMFSPDAFSPDGVPDAVARFRAGVAAFDRAGFLAMMWSSAEADLRGALAGIGVPTLLLYGDRDVRAPLPVGRALHAAIPGARLEVLDGVGHVSPVEAPERFNRAVRDFLRAAPPR